MRFEPGDRVVHKSDKRDRKMVVVAIAKKEMPPTNSHNEMVNIGRADDGSYFCTWISGKNKGQGYFTEDELEELK